MGDSSPADDGTGDPNDVLYDGYFADANGQHQLLLMNATIWLASNSKWPLAATDIASSGFTLSVYPNPATGNFTLTGSALGTNKLQLDVTDISGRVVFSEPSIQINADGFFQQAIQLKSKGLYLVRCKTNQQEIVQKLIVD